MKYHKILQKDNQNFEKDMQEIKKCISHEIKQDLIKQEQEGPSSPKRHAHSGMKKSRSMH